MSSVNSWTFYWEWEIESKSLSINYSPETKISVFERKNSEKGEGTMDGFINKCIDEANQDF